MLRVCTNDEGTYSCRFDVLPYCHRWGTQTQYFDNLISNCTRQNGYASSLPIQIPSFLLLSLSLSWYLSDQRKGKRQQHTDLNGPFSQKSSLFHCFVWRRCPLVKHSMKIRSCIKSCEHSFLKLFLNGLEAVFKQQKPCSNHDIRVLFEHGFWTFDITRWALLCLRYVERRNVIALNVAF